MALTMTKEIELPSLEDLCFPDDFEEYRARAISGGSLFGLLRREAFARGSVKEKVPPNKRKLVRQRSRSLIPKSVALPEDKAVLKVLCEYSESNKKLSDFEVRRHSTACVVGRSEGCMHSLPLKPPEAARPPGGDTPVYRILMLGGPGVGKTALSQQFLTSEYMAAQNTSFGKPISSLI